MTEAELLHQEETVLDRFVYLHHARIRRHHLGDPCYPRAAAGRHHAIHYVTFGEDSCQLAAAHHRRRSVTVGSWGVFVFGQSSLPEAASIMKSASGETFAGLRHLICW